MINRQRQVQSGLSRFTIRSMVRDRGLYVATVVEPLQRFISDYQPSGKDETDYDQLRTALGTAGVTRLAKGRSERVERLSMRTLQAAAIGEVWQLSKLQAQRELVDVFAKGNEDLADAALRAWLEDVSKSIGVTTRMLEPATSVRTLRALIEKTVLTSDQFDRLSAAMRAHAFRVWTLNDLGIVQSLRQSIVTSLTNGRGFRAFWNEMNHTLVAAKLPERPFWHASVVYQNNVAAAYSDAKNAVINTRVAHRMFPFRRYMTRNNARVRPTHRALHGLVFEVDDPFWKVHDPPWEHNCRCYVETVTQQEAEKRGYRIAGMKDVQRKGVKPAKNFTRTGSTFDAGGLDDDLRKQLEREIEKREKRM